MSPASTGAQAKKASRKTAPPSSKSVTAAKSANGKGAEPGQVAKSAKAKVVRETLPTETGIFKGYSKGPYGKAFDEMFDADGEVRPAYRGIFKVMAESDRADLEARVDALGRAFIDQGITFSLSGMERPFPLDVVPRVISAGEWNKLEAGITQRVQALELFLDDCLLYTSDAADE